MTGTIPEGRKRKRAKLERLENWGETDVEAEVDVRSWLIARIEPTVASKRMKHGDGVQDVWSGQGTKGGIV